jgi:aminopeptidase
MDDRIRRHAETLVDWSARIEAGDDVVVRVGEGAHDLGVAVAAALGERDANLLACYDSDELRRAYLRAHDGAFASDPEFERAMYERADSVLSLRGTRNTAATADVSGEREAAFARARAGVREARLDTDWVSTVHPTRALAQQAGMSLAAYREFVYGAVLRDWASLAEEMARLKEILDAGETVHLSKGEQTALTLDIAGRTAVNSTASVADDSHNLPSGEVFTAPAGTEGTVVFDVPMTLQGTAVEGVRLEFADGEVVDWAAERGADTLAAILGTDAGARRLGELGVGMNRGIDRPTGQILFDEKMAGTVHLALGRAYDACLPGGEGGTDSAVHADLITHMDEGSELVVDGETVQRDGYFRWEAGFE